MRVPFHCQKHGGGTDAVTRLISLVMIGCTVCCRSVLCGPRFVPDRHECGSMAVDVVFTPVRGGPLTGIAMLRSALPCQWAVGPPPQHLQMQDRQYHNQALNVS